MADSRRRFLKTAAWGAAGAARLRGAAKTVPPIRIRDKTVSRLVAGGNPIGGYSYGTSNFTKHMLSYFTVERITGYLLHAEEEGINTFQSHYATNVRDALLAARDAGCKIQWICLTSESTGELKPALALHPLAVSHHGGVTDRFFREGKPDKVHDFVKQVRDAGVLAGISLHNPDNLARIEDSGWENDFYMACFYNLTRTPEDIKATLGQGVLGPVFFESDPERMTRRIREVKKPCLGFKILGAGRLASNASSLDRAFAFAYSSIKPSDGVIVGMFPVFADEIRENADLARKHGAPA